ncbi:MAG: alpha/beta fold hydrolase [Pirellulales bacterium]
MENVDLERSKPGAARHRGEAPADAWFAEGERIGYDPHARALVGSGPAPLRVWVRRDGDPIDAVSFLPGFPDGSFGWSKLLPNLPDEAAMPKLFVEYVGMGDSDKPRRYAYSTAERTDLIEAHWRYWGVRSTTLVAFDFSAITVLEHLCRRLEGSAEGPSIRGVFIFNGGLYADGHSHPWFTTPLLSRHGGGMLPWFAQRSFFMFRKYIKMLGWSPEYRLTDEELYALRTAMARRNGLFYLAAAAGFVADQKRQSERLDFSRIFDAYHKRFPFLVGGSRGDVFERRQVDLAEQRLAGRGLRVARLLGGHFTTSERPAELARLIAGFEKDLAGHKSSS